MSFWNCIVLFFFGVPLFAQNVEWPVEALAQKIEWFGQSAVKIPFAKDKTIYIDPYNLPANDVANVVFITHSHADHLDGNELAKVVGVGTIIVAPVECEEKLRLQGFNELVLVNPFDEFEIEGCKVNVVPAYNQVASQFHPRDNKWVGYVISCNEIAIYHPGDTERIPEMKTIKCDIAFMPLGQTYTMRSVTEAIEATVDVSPQIAIPFHYGIFEGSIEDAKVYERGLKGKIRVIIKVCDFKK